MSVYPFYPVLANEEARLQALRSHHILDTAEETDFDELAALASGICQVPVSLITLVDKDRQWFKAHKGTDVRETPRELSFCSYAIADPGNVMIVPDLTQDVRFAANPLVTGETQIIFYAGVPLVDHDGFALGTLCVVDHEARDLTQDQVNSLVILARQVVDKIELRRKTAALAEANEVLGLAMEAGALGTFDVDLASNLANISLQCKLDFGRFDGSSFDLPDLLKSILPEYRAFVERQIADAIESNGSFKIEFAIAWPDGSKHWISTAGKVRFNPSGIPTHLVGVTQDITSRKDLDSRKDEFLGMISHELKTPITSLKASLQLLDTVVFTANRSLVPVLMNKSLRSADKINGLVDDLLNMHRFSETEVKMGRQQFSLDRLLATCIEDTKVGVNIEIKVEGDTDVAVFADEFRVEQVIKNLLNNAIKYAPNSFEILVTIEMRTDDVLIRVRDQGPGIPIEYQPHLFEHYWRADYWGKAYSGLGLGLYICSEIIRKHGGAIGVISAIGEGTTFWFTLPT